MVPYKFDLMNLEIKTAKYNYENNRNQNHPAFFASFYNEFFFFGFNQYGKKFRTKIRKPNARRIFSSFHFKFFFLS